MTLWSILCGAVASTKMPKRVTYMGGPCSNNPSSLGEALVRDAEMMEQEKLRLPLNRLRRTKAQRTSAEEVTASRAGEERDTRDIEADSLSPTPSSICSLDIATASPGRVKNDEIMWPGCLKGIEQLREPGGAKT